MKRVIKYFLQGLLYTAPVAVTLYAFYQVFYWVDHMIDGLLPEDSEMSFTGLGVIVIFVGVTAVGVFGSYLLKFPIFSLIEDKLERIPVFNLIYTSIKDFLKSFTGQRKGFKHPVLIKLYENSEIRRLGFVTDDAQDLLKDDEGTLVTVYVPHSFAISGQLFMVPPKYITEVKENSTDVMKYILAGGITEVGEKEEDAGA
ncbi:DUF502 domain-containing protein [Phaeocystidibacter luteus]|uniref:DUF502 domain-containing protein n=1 Tax=Phaeocystidibacter luteus TaxID=911197 RepID=A0A6N6RJY2_9FLAO|nr:DUF502 domain-containing protein [Phaeocystidibacter luteus]